MAREAVDVLFAIGKLGVDFASHADHHARDFLFGVLIAIEGSRHVTVRALYTERSRERLHGLHIGIRRQQLQVLGSRPGTFLWGTRRGLGEHPERDY